MRSLFGHIPSMLAHLGHHFPTDLKIAGNLHLNELI